MGGPPPAADIPPTTPDFSTYQIYFGQAPSGIDVAAARAWAGGRGETVRVYDCEDAWDTDHEDWPPIVSLSGFNYTSIPFRSHGAAVVGMIAAAENGYGMTGIAPAGA